MKNYIFTILLCSLSLISCDNEDDNDTGAMDPILFIANSEYLTDFHTPGETDIPNITWNGGEGSFSILEEMDGLSIDANTGQLTWSRILEIGDIEVTIIATNLAGLSKSETIIIHNMFAGLFEGGYNTDPTSTDYPINHSTNMRWDTPADNIGSNGMIISTGLWTRDGATVKWCYDLEDGTTICFCGTLEFDEVTASISGLISFSGDFEMPDGSFYLERDY